MAHIKAPPLGKTKSVPIPSQNLHIDPRGKTRTHGARQVTEQKDLILLKARRSL